MWGVVRTTGILQNNDISGGITTLCQLGATRVYTRTMSGGKFAADRGKFLNATGQTQNGKGDRRDKVIFCFPCKVLDSWHRAQRP